MNKNDVVMYVVICLLRRMASVRKVPRVDPESGRRIESKNWVACYTDGAGKRRQKSTGETNQSKALAKAIEWEKPYRDSLSPEKSCLNALSMLREHKGLLRQGMAKDEFRELYEEVFKIEIKAGTVRKFAEGWLSRRESELKPRSFLSYKGIVGRFIDFLGPAADEDIRLITKSHILNYRSSVSERLSARTANNHLKTLRVFLNDARRDELIDRNPAEDVKRLLESKESERRAFTLAELQDVLAVAGGEWRGIILFGIYTGQRLGDVARLTWANVDLEQMQIRFTTSKTGRRMRIPMISVLSDYLAELDVPEQTTSPLFPSAYAQVERYGSTQPLSKAFGALLVEAGLVSAPKPEESGRNSVNAGRGQSNARRSRGLSFHCLRHTTTSLLKNAGVSEAVVMDLVGHDSKAVSAMYTHVEDGPKKEALSKLPDVTK